MKVLYIGYAISKEEASRLYGASVAGNMMQIKVLEQLSKYPDMEWRSITIYPTAAYPRGKLLVKRKRIRLFRNFDSLRVGFINLPIVKQIFITLITYLEARYIVRKEGIRTIFTFNMFPEAGLPAIWLKKRYGCEVITLLADLPIDDTVGRRGISLWLRKYFDRLTKKAIASCDRIVALNGYACESYAPKTDYIVMEGGVDPEEYSEPAISAKGRRNLVYSGALSEYSGIINLIKAMRYVKDPQVTLDIFGRGQLEEQVREYAGQLPNVRYHGNVDHERMRQFQREAYLLVNPRPVDHPIAKVTFPSKIFEYMMSGTPVITTRLNGLTDDYLDKFYTTERDDPQSIGERLNEVLELPVEELTRKALSAREFLKEQKTWEVQCRKIYQFIKAGHHDGNE